MTDRPTVCLSMIVRDEAAVVSRALGSVLSHVDRWAVIDTGSTDATREIVRSALASLPGALTERPWVNFGHNRNEALEAAEAQGCDYVLVLDADQTFEGSLQIDPAIDAYDILQRMGQQEWPLCKLTRSSLRARYSGATHEGFALPDGATKATLMSGHIVEHGDSSRRATGRKNTEDLELLQAQIAADPADARALFYLAQTLRDMGRTDEAIEAYERRAAAGSVYQEERWWALHQVAILREGRGDDPAVVIAAYQAAINARPERAESHYELARVARLQQRHDLAHSCAATARACVPPAAGLFVDRSAFLWKASDELALAANALGRPDEAAQITVRTISSRDTPDHFRDHLRENLACYMTAASPHAISKARAGVAWTGPDPVVISSAHNPRFAWAVACIESVGSQTVKCRHIYTINADAPDLERIQDYADAARLAGFDLDLRVIDGPDFFVAHLSEIVRDLPPETIVACVDGDDYLLPDDAVERVMIEHVCGALVTYGQFSPGPAEDWGAFRASPYSRAVVDARDFRNDHWRASHLKTFRAGLIQRIRPEDLRGPAGDPIRYCWDQAVMLPALEMAGERATFIADPIYAYRVDNPASDHNNAAATAAASAAELAHVRGRPKYDRIEWRERSREWYIVAPPYTHASAGVVVLHRLCHKLREIGIDAYVSTPKTNPEWNTPFKAMPSDDAIVVYPESVGGNPLRANHVLRYVLYHPGKIGSTATEYDPAEFVAYFDEAYRVGPGPVVRISPIDAAEFFDDGAPKTEDVVFVYKGDRRGAPWPEGATEITPEFPASRSETASLLRRARRVYSYDVNTALLIEAAMCGAETFTPSCGQWARRSPEREPFEWDDLSETRKLVEMAEAHFAAGTVKP